VCGEIFGDDTTATAMIDRLVHHAEIVSLKGDSWQGSGVYFLTFSETRTLPGPGLRPPARFGSRRRAAYGLHSDRQP
jgi:hypothetical protein